MSYAKETSLKLTELLGEEKYKVPVYQRNYDWGEAQIRQLINDIQDFAEKNSNAEEANKQNYYLGSLIVHQREDYFEILDGQQRFTTLSLLAIYLKYRFPDNFYFWYKEPNLSFESRPKSDRATVSLFKAFDQKSGGSDITRKEFLDTFKTIDTTECSAAILAGFKTIENVVVDVFPDKEGSLFQEFINYLLNNVEILRVFVPKNTDVTHYFEVMNNRGEQLEKHEVVKARLLSTVQDAPDTQEPALVMAVIQKVWLACSDMNRYVQAGFKVQERKAIFGDSAEDFKITKFSDLTTKVFVNEDLETPNRAVLNSELTFDESLKKGRSIKNNDSSGAEEDESRRERFSSVIDFPNFLMHVLRIYIKANLLVEYDELPSLDDKDLLDSFDKYIGDDSLRAKKFIFELLKTRHLFDNYIIKRDRSDGIEDWALQSYKFDDNSKSSYVNSFSVLDGDNSEDNKKCLMLLSAFHVSYPTNSRKNWLSAVLYRLSEQEPSTGKEYLVFLESLAKAFMVNRYLIYKPNNYLDFMYDEQAKLATFSSELDVPGHNLSIFLKYGKITVFVFNYLDYLLWRDRCSSRGNWNKFKFSFKNSVEHFSPQTPKANESLKEDFLHSFGNLCLMASGDNSSLSNDGPEQKANILQLRRDSMAPFSLKLDLMIEQADAWSASAEEVAEVITAHEEKMFKVIQTELRANFE